MSETIKLRAGKFLVPVKMDRIDGRIFLQFGYNKILLNEIKMMEGAKWHGFETPPRKVWSVTNCPRNDFQFDYLQGGNPYAWYDRPVKEFEYTRPLYEHQRTLTNEMLTYHYHIAAAGCGVGKTLCAIEAAEHVNPQNPWYIAPRSALMAVEREFRIWDCKIKFKMFTYEGLVKEIKAREPGPWVPQMLILDEASKARNATAQRSQASRILADLVRQKWGQKGYVLELSGTPAPKDPTDWHNLCEIACPGFVRESTKAKLKQTLAIQKPQDNAYGGKYYETVAWRDDEKKCETCGEPEEHHGMLEDEEHDFVPSVNEVYRFSKRLQGLVSVRLKEDCLDLPDKIERHIELPPTEQMLQVAQTILQTASTTIGGLTLLRELSDGFQYRDIPDGTETCPVCAGTKRTENPLYGSDLADGSEEETTLCDGCGGVGTRKKYKRISEEVDTPKERAMVDLFDEFNDVGRLVAYGGFTGSIDRLIKICESCGWQWIRVDGRGWHSSIEGDYLENFQDKLVEIPKLAFIGHPGSAGMGLTLTASPVVIYYSNDFDAEYRMQSMERCHRPGMDFNLGCTIIDLFHLPTDHLVYQNLMKKFKLQNLSMGRLQECFNDS